MTTCGCGESRRQFLKGVAGFSALLPFYNIVQSEAFASGDFNELEVAKAAEKWIWDQRIETENGPLWVRNPEEGNPDQLPTFGLYHGVPGVALFYMELFNSTKDPVYLRKLKQIVGSISHFLDDVEAYLAQENAFFQTGLYGAFAGNMHIFLKLYELTGDVSYKIRAKKILTQLRSQKIKMPNGIRWAANYNDFEYELNDLIEGGASVGLALMDAKKHLGDPVMEREVIGTGDYLLNQAMEAEEGLLWRMSPSYERLLPNFSHGTAGIAFFLARLYEETGDKKYLNAAMAGANHLKSIANYDHGGPLVYHSKPGGESRYYLSWCHGPVGTSRLFHALYRITKDEMWSKMSIDGSKAIEGLGVPEKRTSGFWNNVSQCCGDAGVGEYYLNLHAATGDKKYLIFARERLGRYILTKAKTEADNISWKHAENRTDPEGLASMTGWMQGAAGIGGFFLHLHNRLKGKANIVHLPDNPWPNPGDV